MVNFDKLFKILWTIIGFCILTAIIISLIIFIFLIVNPHNHISGIPVNSLEDGNEQEIKETKITIGLTGKYKNIIYVEIKSNLTGGNVSDDNKLYYREYYLDQPETVNFYFHNLYTNERYYLFDKNKYIDNIHFPSTPKNGDEPFEYFIFVIIENDTNQNKLLDRNDNKSIYISDYSGKNVELLSENLHDYTFIGNNEILITTGENDKFIGYSYKFKEREILKVFEIQK